jgi:hypothetical protein
LRYVTYWCKDDRWHYSDVRQNLCIEQRNNQQTSKRNRLNTERRNRGPSAARLMMGIEQCISEHGVLLRLVQLISNDTAAVLTDKTFVSYDKEKRPQFMRPSGTLRQVLVSR